MIYNAPKIKIPPAESGKFPQRCRSRCCSCSRFCRSRLCRSRSCSCSILRFAPLSAPVAVAVAVAVAVLQSLVAVAVAVAVLHSPVAVAVFLTACYFTCLSCFLEGGGSDRLAVLSDVTSVGDLKTL